MNRIILVLVITFAFAAKIESAAHAQQELNQALFTAIEKNDLGAVQQALHAGADMSAYNGYFILGIRPLLEAASAGCLAVVNQLLQNGADVNISGRNGTALHQAVRYPANPAQAPAIVNRLLNAGIDVKVRDGEGRTPLHAITLQGVFSLEDKYAIPVVFQLLEAGVERCMPDFYGDTALTIMQKAGRPILAELIKSYPGRNLQERIIFSLAKNYSDADAAGQERIEQQVMRVGMGPYYVDLFYKLIGKEQLGMR